MEKSTKAPLISVLMPVYNAEKYLHEAIDSILGQTFSDFEFIIVNDGSTDSSREIILGYKDSRIKYVENEDNLDLAKSLNRGLAEARGEFIARMDADDISLPDRFAIQINIMQTYKVDICSTAVQVVDGNGNIIGAICPQNRAESDLAADFLCDSHPFLHPTVMIKRSALEEVGGYNPDRYIEDFDLWVRMFLAGKKALVIPEKLLKYRRVPTAKTAEGSPNRQIAYNDVLLTIKDYIKKIVCVENPTIVNQVLCDSIAAFFLGYQAKYVLEQRPDLDIADLLFFRKAFQKKFSYINYKKIVMGILLHLIK